MTKAQAWYMYKQEGETEKEADFKDLADGMNSAVIRSW
jgi:hypothetical protein